MKQLLLLSLLSLGLFASEDKPSLIVQVNPVMVSSNDDQVCTVLYTDHRFIIVKEKEIIPVDQSQVDENLIKINCCKDLAEYLKHGNGLKVIRSEQGEYRIEALFKLKGGGVGGANVGFWIGKGLTYAIGYGVVNVAAAFSGPAAPGVVPAANLMAAPVIEGWSNAVGISFGLIGGIFTGPV